MQYILKTDYEYIINKYHDTAKPFDPFKRFLRNDAIFAEESGLSPAAIEVGILKNDEKYASLSHPVRKARALSYVLKNTRISCDPHDIFPAINMVDRPLNRILIGTWRQEVFCEKIPEVEARRAQLEKDGIVTIWPDYDHSVPDWERLLILGFLGILRESEEARKGRTLTAEQEDFFEGIRITYEGVLAFVGRLAELAERTEGAGRMASALRHLEKEPPSTFYEALLLAYLYFMIISTACRCARSQILIAFSIRFGKRTPKTA